MDDGLSLCIAACYSTTGGGAFVGNATYDLGCIKQCSQGYVTLHRDTAKKYTRILQIIAIVLLTFGLIGKVFNFIVFLRKSLRGTSTGLLLLFKTLFDIIPLLWTFIFDTKFFVNDHQLNTSPLSCILSRSSDIFISWSIGFVILVCIVHLAAVVYSKYFPHLRIFALILSMMLVGLIYNWHIFYYPNVVKTTIDDNKNRLFTYCNILFGRQMGYFSYGGFRGMQEFLYNVPIVNLIVSSLIPFAIVATTNILIIIYIFKAPPKRDNVDHNDALLSKDSPRSDPLPSTLENTKTKEISYETTIILTTSCVFCVFLIANSIANIYVHVRTSHRSNRSRLMDDLKTSNVYLILRMVALSGTVLEFYVYFLTGKKFRKEVFDIIRAILKRTPLKNRFQSTSSSSPIPTTTNVSN